MIPQCDSCKHNTKHNALKQKINMIIIFQYNFAQYIVLYTKPDGLEVC